MSPIRKKRKSNIFTKLVVLALVIYTSVTLIGLHSQILNAEAARAELQETVQELERALELYEREIENSDDLEVIERIARNRYHLVMPGERVFYGVTG